MSWKRMFATNLRKATKGCIRKEEARGNKPPLASIIRRQANGCNRILTLFYDNSGRALLASSFEIPDGWTPQLFLGLLLQEWCLSYVISLYQIKDEACDDIFKMRLLYYNHNAAQLKEFIQSSPSYSFVTGGLYFS
jgi:hypothetical protein